MILPLAYYGNPILRQKGSIVPTIDADIHKLVEDMVQTMQANDGIGIAAPQVSRSLAIFITQIPEYREDGSHIAGPVKVYINPKLINCSQLQEQHSEGCLSIPKVYGNVSRPIHIVIEAENLQGQRFQEQLSGLEARCCLHENDHINGVLFIDRIRGKERQQMEEALRKIKQLHK